MFVGAFAAAALVIFVMFGVEAFRGHRKPRSRRAIRRRRAYR
jgi:hypothetical protein